MQGTQQCDCCGRTTKRLGRATARTSAWTQLDSKKKLHVNMHNMQTHFFLTHGTDNDKCRCKPHVFSLLHTKYVQVNTVSTVFADLLHFPILVQMLFLMVRREVWLSR